MSTSKFEAEIKTRVPGAVKEELERIAGARHLDLSDIAREAFRDFLARNPPDQTELPLKKETARAA